MRNVTVIRTPSVTIHMSADDWELYSHHPGARDAANDINHCIELSINGGMSKDQAEKVGMAKLREYAELGALDSEPLWHFENLLAEVYGR